MRAFPLGVNMNWGMQSVALIRGQRWESKNSEKPLKSRVESRKACSQHCCVHRLLNKQGTRGKLVRKLSSYRRLANEMAQQLKVLAAKPGDLSLIPPPQ